MVLEMKRALEDLKSGDRQGYRKIFDATCEEVYCRSLLILQREDSAKNFMRGFFGELFGMLDEADDAQDQEKWFWQKYYRRMRKQYHKLLAEQEKEKSAAGGVKTLAEIPSSLPLLHRIMLLMFWQDDFTAAEISKLFGLPEDKIEGELAKLEKLLPALTKGQPDSVAGYLANWKVLLMGAFRQIISTGSDEWVDGMFQDAAADAGIAVQEPVKDNFEYFIADVDVSPVKSTKKSAPVLEEEPEDEDEDEEEYDEDEDDEEYDDDDEYDDEDDDRYDWDLEDDGKKMVILGVVLALVIVLVAGVIGYKLLNRDKTPKESVQTEEQADDEEAALIIKGDGPGEGDDASEEQQEEEPVVEEPEEPEEPETLVMMVNGSNINVRSEASTDSAVVTKVNSPEHVEVLGDPNEEWVQIRCVDQNGEEGYVKSEFLSGIAAE